MGPAYDGDGDYDGVRVRATFVFYESAMGAKVGFVESLDGRGYGILCARRW